MVNPPAKAQRKYSEGRQNTVQKGPMEEIMVRRRAADCGPFTQPASLDTRQPAADYHWYTTRSAHRAGQLGLGWAAKWLKPLISSNYGVARVILRNFPFESGKVLTEELMVSGCLTDSCSVVEDSRCRVEHERCAGAPIVSLKGSTRPRLPYTLCTRRLFPSKEESHLCATRLFSRLGRTKVSLDFILTSRNSFPPLESVDSAFHL